MIKTIDQIKLKHLAKMERTGKIRQFLSWWNIAPTVFFIKRLQKYIPEVYSIATGNNHADVSEYELESLEWQCRSLLKINSIESAYQSCVLFLHIVVGYDYNLNRFRLTRRQRRQIKHVDIKLLEKSVENIRLLTGIEIKKEADIVEVQKELIWLKEKYNENFGEKTENKNTANKKKMTILEYAGSFANYAGSSFSDLPNMTVPTFVDMRNTANNKYEAEKKHFENRNQNFEQ